MLQTQEGSISSKMKWYRCSECGELIAEDNLDYQFGLSDYCEGVPVLKGKECCPKCGCTELWQLNACDMCGEPTENDEYELCASCRAIAKDVKEYAQNMWGYGLHELVNLLDTYENEQE